MPVGLSGFRRRRPGHLDGQPPPLYLSASLSLRNKSDPHLKLRGFLQGRRTISRDQSQHPLDALRSTSTHCPTRVLILYTGVVLVGKESEIKIARTSHTKTQTTPTKIYHQGHEGHKQREAVSKLKCHSEGASATEKSTVLQARSFTALRMAAVSKNHFWPIRRRQSAAAVDSRPFGL